MPNLINMPPFTEDGDVYVVVETPRGSRVKFDYDPKLKTFTLSKSLLTGLTYPHDRGFVPSTKADDGDPIDIMVVHDAATFPGIVLTCRVIGILQIEQKSKGKTERNDRLFAVPKDSHAEQALKDVRDLSEPIQQELEKLFKATDELEDKKLNIIGWKGPKAAVEAIVLWSEGAPLERPLVPDRARAVLVCPLRCRRMKMANVASTAPGNIWTRDEFLTLVRDTVANLLDVERDELLKAGEVEINNAVKQVCCEINSPASTRSFCEFYVGLRETALAESARI